MENSANPPHILIVDDDYSNIETLATGGGRFEELAIYSGQVYFWAMFAIFATAIPMSILKPNLFLLLIAIFSFYFALIGLRLAKNRRGTPHAIDWVTVVVMMVTGLAMSAYGAYMLSAAHDNGIVMLAFGLFGCRTGYRDFQRLRTGGLRGQTRIARHLTSMLGASIATLTAFLTTNINLKPEWILWLGPALLITPFIVWWNRQLRAGRRISGPEITAPVEPS